MQALRPLIKVCLALAAFGCQAADLKVSLRVDGWRLVGALQSLEGGYAPPVSAQHLTREPSQPRQQPATVFVGGVQHRLPPAPRRD